MDPNSEAAQPNQAEAQAGTETPAAAGQTQTATAPQNRGFFGGLLNLVRGPQQQQEASAPQVIQAPQTSNEILEPPPPPVETPPPAPMPDQTPTFEASSDAIATPAVAAPVKDADTMSSGLGGLTNTQTGTGGLDAPAETGATFEPPPAAPPPPPVESASVDTAFSPLSPTPEVGMITSAPTVETGGMPDVTAGPLPPPTGPASSEPTMMPPASEASPVEASGGAPVSSQTSDSTGGTGTL